MLVGPRGTAIDVDERAGEWRRGGDRRGTPAASPAARSSAPSRSRCSGDVDGIVTAPLDKAALLAGGYDYPGHTEMLATLTGRSVAMMLAATRPNESMTNPLRVVLATTHLPLRDVPRALTTRRHRRSRGERRATGLRDWFGIAEPRIALCALNPHAGDGGRFGREDDEVLRPRRGAPDIAGPFPADTVFVRAMRGAFDAVIAPYHDVGMTAIKVASFGSAVNVTLGLPFPRTSPDHGTALDIAGRGIADPSSMIEAILLASQIAQASLCHRAERSDDCVSVQDQIRTLDTPSRSEEPLGKPRHDASEAGMQGCVCGETLRARSDSFLNVVAIRVGASVQPAQLVCPCDSSPPRAHCRASIAGGVQIDRERLDPPAVHLAHGEHRVAGRHAVADDRADVRARRTRSRRSSCNPRRARSSPKRSFSSPMCVEPGDDDDVRTFALGCSGGSSYSSRISPTISSSRSSIVTTPAVPPYSSSTIAMCSLSRLKSASTSSTSREPGTTCTGRMIARKENSAGGWRRIGKRSFASTRPMMLSIVSSYTGYRDRWVSSMSCERFVQRRVERQRVDLRARCHHLARILFRELEHSFEHVGVRRLQHATFLALLDEHAQLFRRVHRFLERLSALAQRVAARTSPTQLSTIVNGRTIVSKNASSGGEEAARIAPDAPARHFAARARRTRRARYVTIVIASADAMPTRTARRTSIGSVSSHAVRWLPSVSSASAPSARLATRDAELARRQQPREIRGGAKCDARQLVAGARHRLEARASRPDQRELGGDEEGVQREQYDDGDQARKHRQ